MIGRFFRLMPVHWRWFSIILVWAAGFILLVAVAATTGFYVGTSSGYREAVANGSATARTRDAESRVVPCKAMKDVGKFQRCVEEALRSSREGRMADLNLEAQQAMVRWNGWLLKDTMRVVLVFQKNPRSTVGSFTDLERFERALPRVCQSR